MPDSQRLSLRLASSTSSGERDDSRPIDCAEAHEQFWPSTTPSLIEAPGRGAERTQQPEDVYMATHSNADATPRRAGWTPEDALREYDLLIAPARQRFAGSPGIRRMVSADIDPRTMAAFLLHFSALSVPITEPVEDWIRRAGERCDALGLVEIGSALRAHSKAEAAHHQYHVDDFGSLIDFWNTRWTPQVEGDAIRAHGVTSGGERYSRVHEETIAGDAPYCQFAIEYEIELLPVQYGPQFVDNSVRLLGREILKCMSFATSHIEFDVGHSKFNAHFLGRLIADSPWRLDALVTTGAAALEAFGAHLTECMTLAEALCGATLTGPRVR
jgi:hypothetical protein